MVIKEKLFNARLYHEVYNTIHFIELKELRANTKSLMYHLETLENRCQENQQCNTMRSIKAMKSRLGKINQRQKNIIYKKGRSKKGLFNFVGTGTKFLFGTMDADDAEKIDADIDKIYAKNLETITLLKNQTTITKSLITELETYRNNQLIDLENFENSIKSTINLTNSLSFNLQILNLLNELESYSMDLDDITQEIESSIADARQGRISPQLITPANFIESLKLIKQNLASDMPFPLVIDNYFLYLRISTVDTVLVRDRLIFRTHTPIPTKNDYTVIRLVPVIKGTPPTVYLVNNLHDGPIAVDEKTDTYTLINLHNCKEIDNDHFCKQTTPVRQIKNDVACIGWILEKSNNPCERKYFKTYSNLFHSFDNGYQWMITPARPMTVTVKCIQEPNKHIPLSQPTILTLDDHCMAITDEFDELLPSIKSNNQRDVKMIKINLTLSDIENEILKEPQINLPTFHQPTLHINEIKGLASSLEVAQDQYENLLKSRRQNSLQEIGMSILQKLGYLALIIICIALIWRCGLPKLFKFMAINCCPESCGRIIYKNVNSVIVHNTDEERPKRYAAEDTLLRNENKNFEDEIKMQKLKRPLKDTKRRKNELTKDNYYYDDLI